MARERPRAASLHRARLCAHTRQHVGSERAVRRGAGLRRLWCRGQLRWLAHPSLSNCLEECERQYLLQELTRHDWQMTKTAAAIGISRKNLWERLRRLNLTLPARVLRQEGEQDPLGTPALEPQPLAAACERADTLPALLDSTPLNRAVPPAPRSRQGRDIGRRGKRTPVSPPGCAAHARRTRRGRLKLWMA